VRHEIIRHTSAKRMAVIDDCMRSVPEQEGHMPLWILVHDDASSDGLRCFGFGLTWH